MNNSNTTLERHLKNHKEEALGKTVIRKRVRGMFNTETDTSMIFLLPLVPAGIASFIIGIVGASTAYNMTLGFQITFATAGVIALLVHSLNFWEREESIRRSAGVQQKVGYFSNLRKVFMFPRRTKRTLLSKGYAAIYNPAEIKDNLYMVSKDRIAITSGTHEVKSYRVTSWRGVTIEQVIEPTSLTLWDNTLYESKVAHDLESLIDDSIREVKKEKSKAESSSSYPKATRH